jgi:hypothetical protein
MRLYMPRFTMWSIMVSIVFVSIILAMVTRQERYNRLKQMVINQSITQASAEANAMNAELDRERAEYAVSQYDKTLKERGADVHVRETAGAAEATNLPHTPLIRALANARTEEQARRAIRDLELGEHTATRVAYANALGAVRAYITELDRQCAESLQNQADQVRSADDAARTALQGDLEKARATERVKKIILDLENATLRSLRRELGNRWW